MSLRSLLLSKAGFDVRRCEEEDPPPPALSFHALSWQGVDLEGDDDGDGSSSEGDDDLVRVSAAAYTVCCFGVDCHGRSICLRIDGFTPYFFVYVGGPSACTRFISSMTSQFPWSQHVHKATILHYKDFWGFSNNERLPYVRLSFRSLKSMRMVASMLSKPRGSQNHPQAKLYESNLDPILRFFHIRKLEPAGWLSVPAGSWHVKSSSPGASTTCDLYAYCNWTSVYPCDETDRPNIAPLVVASFDIECGSEHGDFPVAIKDYSKLAYDLLHNFWSQRKPRDRANRYESIREIERAIAHAFYIEDIEGCGCSRLRVKASALSATSECDLCLAIRTVTDDIYRALSNQNDPELLMILNTTFMDRWPLEGDPVIQIGTTFGVYGGSGPPCVHRVVMTLGECTPLAGTEVHCFEDEGVLLRSWLDLIRSSDPDAVLGYNIFGFDFHYLQSRAMETMGPVCASSFTGAFSRFSATPSQYVTKTLSSSALGDNELKYIDMPGRVLIDLMKVIQRDHRLDSYKLDSVAQHFLKECKDDVSPNEIFSLQRGSAEDRAKIAKYCVQDCELCTRLAHKLEIIANNMGMANVCIIPLSFIFMRGQGIKIFSLVSKTCRDEGFVIPVIKHDPSGILDDSYEGAIVLDPQTGMYLDDPVCVLDYNSLYPSSMISHNLSHDSIVLDAKYADLPGVRYSDVSYDVAGVVKTCRYVVSQHDGSPHIGVLPMILRRLLDQRKRTRALLANAEDAFERAVLDGLQNAYKVTANSLYGQMGARTSPLYLKDIAACTTAVGRSMINLAKEFVESTFAAKVIYGDTDSIFVVFPHRNTGLSRLEDTIRQGQDMSSMIKSSLPPPHHLEYEKTFFPFILLSKKRYVGLLYGNDASATPVQKSMGIALKRRDYASITKIIYGGIIDRLLHQRDVGEAVAFLKRSLNDLADGHYNLDELVITKTLRSSYKNPNQIAHWVLAQRMKRRDPGSAPQVNDRIPYVFVENTNPNALMGDRIEHIDYVKSHPSEVFVDILLYIQRQVQQPCSQLLAISLEQLPGYVPMEPWDPKGLDSRKVTESMTSMRERAVCKLLFEPITSVMGVQQRSRQERKSRQQFAERWFAPKVKAKD